MRHLLWLFAVLNAADLASTALALHHGGMAEGNPFMAAVLASLGWLGAIGYKAGTVLLTTATFWALRRAPHATAIMIGLNLILLAVVASNLIQGA